MREEPIMGEQEYRIVVGVDGSGSSIAALRWAIRQAKMTGASVDAVAEVLLRTAKGADLLVLGSRGLGSLSAPLLGSVSLYCVLHAHCPVLVLRDGR
jgi:nucleotide-binding universal stress UspA family protein